MSNIDDIFKNGLNKNGFAYSDEYWDKVAAVLDKKKKRRALLYFSLAATFSLLLVFIFWPTKQIPASKKSQYTEIITGKSNSKSTAAIPPSEGKIITQTPKQTNTSSSGSIKGNSNSIKSIPALPEPVEVIIPDNQITPDVNPNPVVATMSPNPEKPKPEFNLIPKNPFAIFHIEQIIKYLQSSIPFLFVKSIVNIKDSSKINPGWHYQISAGYERNQFKIGSNPSFQKQTEQIKSSHGFNAQFSASNSHLGFKTGLGFLQFISTSNYLTINQNSKYDTTYIMVNPNYGQTSLGTPIALIKRRIETKYSMDTSNNCPNCRTQFSYVKIPLLLSYKTTFKKLNLFVDAGLNTSILVHRKGLYTEFDNHTYTISNTKKSKDIAPVLFQTYCAIGLQFQWTSNISIQSQYGLYLPLNSMTKSYTQKARISFFHIAIGLGL